jgi:hypothetical protein
MNKKEQKKVKSIVNQLGEETAAVILHILKENNLSIKDLADMRKMPFKKLNNMLTKNYGEIDLDTVSFVEYHFKTKIWLTDPKDIRSEKIKRILD